MTTQIVQYAKPLLLISVLAVLISFSNIAECGNYSGGLRYSNKATELMRKRNYSGALQVLNVGIMKYPNLGALYYQRGVLYQDYLREYMKAINDYDKKIKLDRAGRADFAKIYYRRGSCKYKLGFIIPALSDFNTAIKLTPRYDKALFSRAKAYAKIGRLDEAQRDLQKCVKVNPAMTGAANRLLGKIMSGSRDF